MVKRRDGTIKFVIGGAEDLLEEKEEEEEEERKIERERSNSFIRRLIIS